jgi:hypothetical protein
MVKILCTHVCKWKNYNLLKLFQEWGRRNKGEWWRESIQVRYICYIVRTFVNTQCTPTQHNQNNFKDSKLLKMSFNTYVHFQFNAKLQTGFGG